MTQLFPSPALSHVTIEDRKTHKEDENLSTTMVMIETVHPRWNLIRFPRRNHEIKIKWNLEWSLLCPVVNSILCRDAWSWWWWWWTLLRFFLFFISEWIRGWNVSDYTATPIILFTHWRFIPLYARRQRPFIRSILLYYRCY